MWASQRYFQSPVLITIFFPANDIPKTWGKGSECLKKGTSPGMQRCSPALLSFHTPANERREEKYFLQPAILSWKGKPGLPTTDTFFPHSIWLQDHTLLSSIAVSPRLQSAPHNENNTFQKKSPLQPVFYFTGKWEAKPALLEAVPGIPLQYPAWNTVLPRGTFAVLGFLKSNIPKPLMQVFKDL